MTTLRIGGWRVEARLVGLAGFDGGGEGVVDFEDGVFGEVATGLDDFSGGVGLLGAGLVFAADDGEGVHDVGRVLAGQAVEMEEGGVRLAPQQKPALPPHRTGAWRLQPRWV